MSDIPHGYPTMDDWFARIGPQARREFVAAGLRLAARYDSVDANGEPHERFSGIWGGGPVVKISPAPIQFFVGQHLSGRTAYLRVVDLGDVIPGLDDAGNMFEAYTTLFSIDGGLWGEIVVDRALCERSGNPENYRGLEMFKRLADAGLDVTSLRSRDGSTL